ncbi:MAG: hypothetical protein K2N38_08210 [Oscillospiraceae bacterium]|nr:hypothetical protein [Oscillospiraceae bacterium]
MIDRTDFETYSGVISNVVSARTNSISFEFAELIKEKTSGARERLQELLSETLETADSSILTEEVLEHILESIASMSEGSKSIWEIVLQLEKHVDPKLLDEINDMDFDNAAGLNGIAGLLARYWKKKELLEENDTVFSYSRSQNAIDNRAASELAALLKKKEQKLIAEVHE